MPKSFVTTMLRRGLREGAGRMNQPRNPFYERLRVSRIMVKMANRHGDALPEERARYARDSEAISQLVKAGLLTRDEASPAYRRNARRYHAAVLCAFWKSQSFAARRLFFRRLMSFSVQELRRLH